MNIEELKGSEMSLDHLLNDDGLKLELAARLNRGEEFEIVSIRPGEIKEKITSKELIENQLLNNQ